MISRIHTATNIGYDTTIIDVECDMSKSLPSLQIVGLGNKAVDEARERVRSAITNSLLDFPKKRITINLAPAEIPKDGAHFDLPIALAILCASNQIKQESCINSLFAGELALDGTLKPINGIIGITQTAKEEGIQKMFLPKDNAQQACLIEGIEIYGVSSLKELFLHLKQELVLQPFINCIDKISQKNRKTNTTSLDDIRGQSRAKRALTIAAAGHHNILFYGPPGSGKTMLARTLPNLLPELTIDEQIEVTKLHSLAGQTQDSIITQRPFRTPHHTSSHISIVGGGNNPKPGEISLAHKGVLFLDEIPEYPRSTLESLRQPLEDKRITITRAKAFADYPADFMLVATMNPCPCGYYGDQHRECTCTSNQILTYQKRLSGPLMDRIDIVVNVPKVSNERILDSDSLKHKQHEETRENIKNVHDIQYSRYNSRLKYNSTLTNRLIAKHARLKDDSKKLLIAASDKLGLSARSFIKTIKVARTIADLESAKDIEKTHIAEALQYRYKQP